MYKRQALGEPMSDDQFLQNAEFAYQSKPHTLASKQIAFVQDILTCSQLIDAVNKMDKDFSAIKK